MENQIDARDEETQEVRVGRGDQEVALVRKVSFLMLKPILTLTILILGMQGPAWAEKPLLSEKVQSLLSAHDLETANAKMMEIYGSSLGDYEADETGALTLVRKYLKAGDYEVAKAVAEFQILVTGAMSAKALAALGDVQRATGQVGGANALYSQALRMDPDYDYAQEQLERLESGEAPTAPKPAKEEEVRRRDDLARFKGRYEMAGKSERVVRVSETCYRSGILRVSPEWKGAGPWDFTSASDLVFEEIAPRSGASAVRLEFTIDPGMAGDTFVASGALKGRFTWKGYLPDGWEPEDCKD